jgi:choline dehydrogenase
VRMTWHDAVIGAGRSLGLPVKEDVNLPDNGEGVGYNPRTIWRGVRQSAAVAYLAPARKRSNLTVISGATVDRVQFEGTTAVGIQYRKDGEQRSVRGAEIILCGGALATPGILERSGIGDPARLAALGIDVVAARPQVGEHMIEHRCLLMQWKMKNPRHSYNRDHRGARLLWTTLRYLLTKKGPMSSATFDMGVWLKSSPGLNRPDTQFLVAPHSLDFTKLGKTTEPFPGMSLVVNQLRPESTGSVHIQSIDPTAPPETIANHRATELDNRAIIDGFKAARAFAAQAPLKAMIAEETIPGPQYQTDEEILQAFDTFATCGYHTVGTCRMGNDPDSVVDPELRVRGVEGLRVMDTSVMPVMPAGNTQGPTMAMAWRAADVIRRGAKAALRAAA